jgi:hypothetical protein
MKEFLNAAGIVACLCLAGNSAQGQMEHSKTREWLQQRKAEQTQTADQIKVFHDFAFSDELEASGISFHHHAVEDANKLYKAVHYDHGTGLAVADVDGDGLLDIYFVSQLGGNELWRNLGNGRFENITDKAGVALGDRVGAAASFADFDNDGDPDLFVTTVRGGNVLFENLGGGRFRDITQQAGVGYVGHSSGAVFFDFDNDGLLDLFVVNVGNYTTEQKGVGGYYVGRTDAFKGHLHPERAEASILYKNMGHGVFKDVSQSMNLVDKSWSGDASFTDLNGDGFPDLYVLNMQGDDHFYENQAGKSFREKTAAYFPKTSWGAMGIKFFDFNQDGRMDLFITDMHSDMTGLQSKASESNFRLGFETQKSEKLCTAEWSETFIQGASNKIFGNSFYLNQGRQPQTEISDQIGAETFWPWGLSAGDVNADGYEDVFITAGMGFGFRYAIDSLLLNENGKRFAASEFILGVEPRLHGRTEKTAFVLDCNGADKDNPLCQGKLGRVPISESLSSRSSAMFDLDNDGDLDIVTNEMNDRPQVLINNLTEKRKVHFLKVQLQGTRSNADGLGAVVKVFTEGKAWTQQHDGKSGYLGQSRMPLYFGLGESAQVSKVEVLWPSGARQAVTGPVAVNQLLKIKESAK